MAIRCKTPSTNITLNNEPLEWAASFLYLGVIIDYQLTFTQAVTYLRGRAMRIMVSNTLRTGNQMPQTYYRAAIRSAVEYSSLTLMNLSDRQTTALELIRNNTMRITLGTSMWTRIYNLQMECNLPPLKDMAESQNTNIAA